MSRKPQVLDEHDTQTLLDLRKHVDTCQREVDKLTSERKKAVANLEGAQASLYKFIDECEDGLPLFGRDDDDGGDRGDDDHGPPDVPPPVPPPSGEGITINFNIQAPDLVTEPDGEVIDVELVGIEQNPEMLALPSPSPAVEAEAGEGRSRESKRSKGK